MDKDSEKPLKIMQVISTIDDPYIFINTKGSEIELMDEDFKKTVRVYYKGGSFTGYADVFCR